MKAILLDRTNAQSVNDFNNTVQKLSNVKYADKKTARTAEDVNKILKDFTSKFPKLKEKKLKNFKRAN